MQKFILLAIVMLLVPFGLFSVFYSSSPVEIPVMRTLAGNVSLAAPKSAFMVFRVPMINLIHGLMAVVMLFRTSDFDSPPRRIGFQRFVTILLLTVAIKSNAEALEFVLPLHFSFDSRWSGFATVATVVIGCAFALAQLRGLVWIVRRGGGHCSPDFSSSLNETGRLVGEVSNRLCSSIRAGYLRRKRFPGRCLRCRLSQVFAMS